MKYLLHILLILIVGCGTPMKILDGRVDKTKKTQGKYLVKYSVLVQRAQGLRMVYYWLKDEDGGRFNYLGEFNLKPSQEPIAIVDYLQFEHINFDKVMIVCTAYKKPLNQPGKNETITEIFTMDLNEFFDATQTWTLERELRELQTLQTGAMYAKTAY